LAACGGILARSAIAENTSLEERLQRLESEVARCGRKTSSFAPTSVLKAAQARQSSTRRVGATLSHWLALAGAGGFGDKGDARFTSANDRFYLRRARINIQGKFWRSSISDSKAILRLPRQATGNRAQLTDAYINWNRSISPMSRRPVQDPVRLRTTCG